MNLNLEKIRDEHGHTNQENNSCSVHNISFDLYEVFFKNIEKELIRKINSFRDGIIFGSVAWLTSDNILKALSNCENVQILIQKEDFLRPDIGCQFGNEWVNNLKKMYDNLKFNYSRYSMIYPIRSLSYGADSTVDPIRCVGYYKKNKDIVPRAHNKFLVFCLPPEKLKRAIKYRCGHLYPIEYPTGVDETLIKNKLCPCCLDAELDFNKKDALKHHGSIDEIVTDYYEGIPQNESMLQYEIDSYFPVAVWTGSFNFTKNATLSFENAVYMQDMSGDNPIINAYLNEHHNIFCLSESLNWNATYVNPEYRFGT